MTLPKDLGDIREPHPVHCHTLTPWTWVSILTYPDYRQREENVYALNASSEIR